MHPNMFLTCFVARGEIFNLYMEATTLRNEYREQYIGNKDVALERRFPKKVIGRNLRPLK